MLNRENILIDPQTGSFVTTYFTIDGQNLGGSFRLSTFFPVVNSGYGDPTFLLDVTFAQTVDSYNRTFEQHPLVSKEEFETDILRKLYNNTYGIFLTWSCNTGNAMIQSYYMQIKAYGEYSGGLINPTSEIIPITARGDRYTCMGDEYAKFMQSVNFTANRWEMYIYLYIDIN